jgi:hypothetical protein
MEMGGVVRESIPNRIGDRFHIPRIAWGIFGDGLMLLRTYNFFHDDTNDGHGHGHRAQDKIPTTKGSKKLERLRIDHTSLVASIVVEVSCLDFESVIKP